MNVVAVEANILNLLPTTINSAYYGYSVHTGSSAVVLTHFIDESPNEWVSASNKAMLN